MKKYLFIAIILLFTLVSFTGTLTATTTSANSAQFVNQITSPGFSGTPPVLVVNSGQKFQYLVTFQNNGTQPWIKASNFKLGSQNPQDNGTWGVSRVSLSRDTVNPGEQVTFSFFLTAPVLTTSTTETYQTYNLQWRMLQEYIQWFGDLTPNVQVRVKAPQSTSVPATPTFTLDQVSGLSSLNEGLTWLRDGSSKQVSIICADWPSNAFVRIGFYKDGNWVGTSHYYQAAECANVHYPLSSTTTSFTFPDPSAKSFTWPMEDSGYVIMARLYSPNQITEYKPNGSRIQSYSNTFAFKTVTITNLLTVKVRVSSIAGTSGIDSSNQIIGNTAFTLAWTSTGAKSCSGRVEVIAGNGTADSVTSFPPATMALSDSRSVRLQALGSYKLIVSCSDATGQSKEDSVTVTSIPDPNQPSISSVSITGLSGPQKDHWLVNTYKTITWQGNKLTKTAIFVCHPQGQPTTCPVTFAATGEQFCSRCAIGVDSAGRTLINLASNISGGSYLMGIANLDNYPNYRYLLATDDSGLKSIRLAVCPYVNNIANYQACGYTAPFKLLPPGGGIATMGAKGHGCIIGTTVKINGVSQTCR